MKHVEFAFAMSAFYLLILNPAMIFLICIFSSTSFTMQYYLPLTIPIQIVQVVMFNIAATKTSYFSSKSEKHANFCSICDNFVPPRTQHCLACDRCTTVFDHHCIYLGNCIGSQNYKQFVRFLIVTILHGIFQMCADIVSLIMEKNIVPRVLSAISIALEIFPTVFSFHLLLYHKHIHKLQLTTYEFLKDCDRQMLERKISEKLRYSRKRLPYCSDSCANFLACCYKEKISLNHVSLKKVVPEATIKQRLKVDPEDPRRLKMKPLTTIKVEPLPQLSPGKDK